MFGAVLLAMPAFTLPRHKPFDLARGWTKLPTLRDTDSSLYVGALIFGVG